MIKVALAIKELEQQLQAEGMTGQFVLVFPTSDQLDFNRITNSVVTTQDDQRVTKIYGHRIFFRTNYQREIPE